MKVQRRKGLLFVVSAPAGTGKTTLVERLCRQRAGVVRSITCTTRKPRKNEVPGIDYHFLTRSLFQKKVEEGEFLEHVELFGEYYGTSRFEVERLLQTGKHVCLVIDTQGARKLKEETQAVSIFISPPSLQELERRLRQRQTETPQAIATRLFRAEDEINQVVHYDYHIVNEELEEAYRVLESIVIAETHRVIGEGRQENVEPTKGIVQI
jgi:guanylate kinase